MDKQHVWAGKRVSELEDRKLDMIKSGSRKEKQWQSVNRTCVHSLGCHNSIRLSSFNNRNFFFSQLWRVAVQDQDIGRVVFFWGFSLACIWPPSYCVFAWYFLYTHIIPCVLTSCFLKNTSQIGLILTYLFTDPISTYCHILKCWGWGLQDKNLGCSGT